MKAIVDISSPNQVDKSRREELAKLELLAKNGSLPPNKQRRLKRLREHARAQQRAETAKLA